MKWFCDACNGIPQAVQPSFLNQMRPQVPATAPPDAEDMELAMAINTSIQSTMKERPRPYSAPESNEGSTSATYSILYNGSSSSPAVTTSKMMGDPSTIPTAPPGVVEVADGPTHYPSIDSSPIDISFPVAETCLPSPPVEPKEMNMEARSRVAWFAWMHRCRGHMFHAGCMSCLEKIQAKRSGCPVCRAKIDQVIKMCAV